VAIYLILVIVVLTFHLMLNVWVVFGAAVTRNRPALRSIHILSVMYGAVIENVSWSCPLTLAEKWCESRAARVPYEGPFLLHYLNAVVYPEFPSRLISWGAIGICLVNLAVYARRHTQQHRAIQTSMRSAC